MRGTTNEQISESFSNKLSLCVINLSSIRKNKEIAVLHHTEQPKGFEEAQRTVSLHHSEEFTANNQEHSGISEEA